MSYCLNPTCPHPENLAFSPKCQFCGATLLLRDRYRVLKALGQGGFGATFLAQDETLPGELSCVIKQLRPSGTAPHVLQMARDLFEREALTLGRIGNHPQIPRLLDFFEEHEQFYLIQEYISGLTLQEEVKRTGVFSEVAVKQFLSEILPLLHYVHEHKVIHRDIKPANLIRRTQDGRLVLIDFGAVKNKVEQVASVSEQTAFTAYAIGTPGFAPPEQMAMRPVYASDIYALGITCIYLLTGNSPKDLEYNPTTGELMWEKKVQHISEHLTVVLRKMLEVSVRNRYQTCQEVLRALEIEPYLDSLAQGLLTKSLTGGQVQTHNRLEDSSSIGGKCSANSSAGTGIAQLAAAIRARRAKIEQSKNVYHSDGVRKAVLIARSETLASSNSGSSNGQRSHGLRQLDRESLLTAYLRGRRDFALHNLSLLNLQGADLPQTLFHSSELVRTNFQGANLYSSDFARANLKQANLKEANLNKAYLNHANLEGADLRGADLSYANLNSANLQGANLCGANLTGAKISPDQLARAKINWMTVRPNGKRGLF
jgi:serine/threonine-protein kinase